MKHVLHVYPQLNCGGTEMVMYNLIKHLDCNQFKVDILTQKPGELDSVFKELGCDVFCIPKTTLGAYRVKLESFFKVQSYDIVHSHTHGDMKIVLKCAKKIGIHLRIAHSHNDRQDLSVIFRFLHSYTTLGIQKNANYFIACSPQAAKWLFPFKYQQTKILFNGIDLQRFSYDVNKRTKIRSKYNIKNSDRVALHVGRHSDEKNLFFILEIAKKIATQGWKFILVGDGPLRQEIDYWISQNNLNDTVICTGTRSDADSYYSAADVFLFPSRYEGLGIVAIEAQTSGLPCIVSQGVPLLADMHLGLFNQIDLKEPHEWIRKMNNLALVIRDRSKYSHMIMSSPYDIHTVVKELENIYNAK